MKKNKSLMLLFVVVVAAVAALTYFKRPKGSIAARPLANFAIEDTASIDKIFIIDTDQRSVLLERTSDSRYWDLNDSLKARKDAVELILKTFKRIKVKAPVPEAARENVIRLLAAGGKKVEIYQGGSKPSKTYIVGNATQDHTGTYMLLETPDGGRSTEPFIVHMEGFTGFLSTRFFTDQNEWRYTGIFDYPGLKIKRIEAIHHFRPFDSFSINYKGGNDIELFDYRGEKANGFDTLGVKEYLLLYKKAHIETWQSHLMPLQEDSLKKSQPGFTFRVHENDGDLKELSLFYKKPVSEIYDEFDNLEQWDLARMYSLANGEVGLAQMFVFAPFVKTTYRDLAEQSPLP